MELYGLALDLCTNRRHLQWICPLLLLAESLLCALIIWKIPYTEIDWSTYMQQVSLYLSGQHNYALIKGSTGPLVYPAAHVYIYSALYHATDGGRDIARGQLIFMALYLVALAIVMSCYRAAGAPPYIFALLVLSKRLHSIFLLRLFNDGVAALFLWAAIYMLQKRQWLLGVLLWSFGVGVKMTLLLVAPAVAVILVLSVGLPKAVSLGVTCALLQVLLGIPFLREDATAYLTRAFEFTRQFLFKWTVNWRFIGEETFLSISFSISLLASHIVSLVVLVAFRWIRPSRQSLPQFLREIFQPKAPRYRVSQSFILTAILESLAIGLLFARSLHYQFFAYIAWATPWLLWKSGFHPLLIISIWIAQEWAWNVFPSTDISSIVVVICLSLQVVGASGGKSSAATAEKTEKESVK